VKKESSQLSFINRMDLDTIEQDWVPPEVFPDLRNSQYIAVDLETNDPNLMTLGPGWARSDGFIVGVAIAAGDFVGYYPIAHEGGGNIPQKKVMKWLQDQLATPNIPKIMHNATYDAGWLRWAGVKIQGTIIDTMVAAPLLDENRFSYSLNNLARDYLNERKDERTLRAAAADHGFDPKAEMWRLNSRFVGAYAEKDAELTLKLWNIMRVDLEKQSLMDVFNLETSLLPVLLDMREKGVKVDLDQAEIAKKKLHGLKKDLRSDIKHETGVDIEPWVAKSVASVFDHYNLYYNKTENNGQPSFTKAFLQACTHPVAAKILRLRELDKASNTFIDNILKFSHKGRIHCEFHQLRSDDGGTVTGRFSSSNPNLQQIPARDPEIKAMIRGLFIPDEGCKWGSFDYSSQEPRLLVHYCASLGVKDRHPSIDDVVAEYHKGDADFHQMVADMAGISRKQAKTVNLGIMYGMGIGKLSHTLDIAPDEAKSLLETYHKRVPFVKGLADMVSQRASKYGQIRTMSGRLCRFDMWEPRTFGYNKPMKKEEAEKEYGPMLRRAFTYKALNRLIQGSAADQTKVAMAECYKEGLVPLLTVHDELCFNVESEEQAARITEIMETSTELKVPSKVDEELGDNWGEVG
jgi:DNA polymerase I-like protein with 3'-5' exonuclease and polymerase domains